MKKILLIISMITMFLLGACSAETVSANQDNPIKIWRQNSTAMYNTLKVVDDDTGVNYIVVSMHDHRGNAISITPRLNADGSVYVNE